jgi:hypothetical protein
MAFSTKYTRSFLFTTGALNRITLANSSYLDYASENFSFSFWFKPTTITGLRSIFRKGPNNVSGYYFIQNGSGMYFVTNQSGVLQVTRWYGFLSTDWQYLTVVRDGVNVRLYKDDVEVSRSVVGSHSNPATSSENFVIGRYGTSYYLGGNILQFRSYDKALSAVERTALYKGDDVSSNLKLYFKCDEISGTTCVDSSGNSYTGTLGGTLTNFFSTVVPPFYTGSIPDIGALSSETLAFLNSIPQSDFGYAYDDLYNVILFDLFIDEDYTEIQNHTPNIVTNGESWAYPTNNDPPEIVNNRLYAVAYGSNSVFNTK